MSSDGITLAGLVNAEMVTLKDELERMTKKYERMVVVARGIYVRRAFDSDHPILAKLEEELRDAEDNLKST